MADDDMSDVVANFIAITGASDEQAIQCLDSHNFKLDEAVQFFFAAYGDGAGAGASGAGGAAATGSPPIPLEDEVRAPIPSKMDRLYGDPMMGMFTAQAAQAAQAAQYGLQRRRDQPPVDVFRDFKAEGEAGGSRQTSGLSELFKPPQDLLCQEPDMESAKAAALKAGKWLLVNVQSPNEFDSHRLNRDTWSHDGLKEMLKVSFLFFQQQDTTQEGRKLVGAYRLEGQLPAVLVVDPITGAMMYSRKGFVGAEKLLEDLVPFLDHGPTDPGAHSIAQNMTLKRKQPAAGAGAGAGGSGRRPMTEEEEMEAAIAASLGAGAGAGPRSASGTPRGFGTGNDQSGMATGADDDDDDMDGMEEGAVYEQIRKQQEAEKAARERKPPEQVQAEAAARLPAEPTDGPSSLRVGFRMPDGSRAQRKFSKEDTVAALHDYVLSQSAEAAGGRRFALAPMGPGAQPLVDLTRALGEAGVAGSLLVVKWED